MDWFVCWRCKSECSIKGKEGKDVSNIRGGRQSKDNEKESNYRERKNFPLAKRLLCCARGCRKVEPTILQINWLPKIVDEAWTFKDLVFLDSLISTFPCWWNPESWDDWFDVLFWFVFCPSVVFLFFPSAPTWLRHQYPLHPAVGTLRCWEHVSRRFEAVNLPSWTAWPWNLFQFEHLWHSMTFSVWKLRLGIRRYFSGSFMLFRSCLYRCCLKPVGDTFSLRASALPWRSTLFCSLASSLHWALQLPETTAPSRGTPTGLLNAWNLQTLHGWQFALAAAVLPLELRKPERGRVFWHACLMHHYCMPGKCWWLQSLCFYSP